jgi:glyoxylase-like metal-dependent hydrolase (beta-lactamase superfamily II)
MLGRQSETAPANGLPAEREAILIDPGCMDNVILNFIESENYNLKGVLITHNHENHVLGIRALMRIYSTQIYSIAPNIYDCKTNIIHDGDVLNIGGFKIDVIAVPGHSADSVVYKIAHFLFTGDVISAGMLGAVSSPYGAMRQISKIQNSIFPMQGNYFVFPGHGPPTSLNVERKHNVSIGRFQESIKRSERSAFRMELLDS